MRVSVIPRMSVPHGRDERFAYAKHMGEFLTGKSAHADSGDVVVREFYVGSEASVFGRRHNLEMVRIDAEGNEAKVMKVHPFRNRSMNGFIGRSVRWLVGTPEMDAPVPARVSGSGRRFIACPDVTRGFETSVLRFPLKERVASERASDVFGRKLGWLSTAAATSKDFHMPILYGQTSLWATT